MSYLINSTTKEKVELSKALNVETYYLEPTLNKSAFVNKNGINFYSGVFTMTIPASQFSDRSFLCPVNPFVQELGWLCNVVSFAINSDGSIKLNIRVSYSGANTFDTITIGVDYLTIK